jgi:hypothetical protein
MYYINYLITYKIPISFRWSVISYITYIALWLSFRDIESLEIRFHYISLNFNSNIYLCFYYSEEGYITNTRIEGSITQYTLFFNLNNLMDKIREAKNLI